jgi:hypothetical protein
LINYVELTELVQLNEEPYESIQQLRKQYLGVGEEAGRFIYIVAPLYFKLDGIELKGNGELNLSLKCHKYFNLADFKLV